MKSIHRLTVLSLLLVTCGCADAVLSAATTTGTLIAQERTVGRAVDDITIWTQIKHHYLQENAQDLLAGVRVEVIEGRVHLTGAVKTPETRIDAVRLAWQPNGVVEVINEIQIETEKKLQEMAADEWIKLQLKGKMLFEKEVKSINYSVEVVKGVVYLMGIAQDTLELNDVTQIASTIKGVDRVVSHVRLKDDPDRS